MTRNIPAASERELAADLERVLRVLHLRYYHTRDSRGSVAGFPDYIILVGGRMVAAELKAEGGKATPDQVAWLHDLARVGALAFVVHGRAGVDDLAQLLAAWKEAGPTLEPGLLVRRLGIRTTA